MAGAGHQRRPEGALLENAVSEAVDLLQRAGRAVAALDDAYNAAYNASTAADGWGGEGHEVAELGEVSPSLVPWFLGSLELLAASGYEPRTRSRGVKAVGRGIAAFGDHCDDATS